MHYPIPDSSEEIVALTQQQPDEEIVAAAIAGVVRLTRAQGRSLDDLTAEVLADDPLLDSAQRRWLSDIVTQAWRVVV
ncbi:hypothetical protein KR51_00021910 [Rubidibacter lacunae KORDI 51-2]|uniref:Uncharacterized protein n=1 Tax=Rubidibacter lacunae KORDI 51-2 TaxID=582515 RepID=U5DJY6_9CHRO|nr:hypothetical protein [Rubidibacter lacunae]ERN41217.1 hypothetical protein KR51_00021910 [Rubidibacter lacunae KORDI 51-2]